MENWGLVTYREVALLYQQGQTNKNQTTTTTFAFPSMTYNCNVFTLRRRWCRSKFFVHLTNLPAKYFNEYHMIKVNLLNIYSTVIGYILLKRLGNRILKMYWNAPKNTRFVNYKWRQGTSRWMKWNKVSFMKIKRKKIVNDSASSLKG